MFDATTTETAKNFWQFDLGNVCIMLSLLVQSLLFYGNASRQHGQNQQKIAELIHWKKEHDLDAQQRDQAIMQLREIAAGMKATAEAISSQLKMMQEELRDLRNRRMRDRPGG